MPVRIHHVNIRTRDLDRSITFYTEAIGLRHGHRPGFGFAGAWLYDGDKPAVHLSGTAEEPGQGSTAFDHVAFSVDDLGEVLERMERLGIRYYGLRSVPQSGTRQCFVKDPDGVTIELQGP